MPRYFSLSEPSAAYLLKDLNDHQIMPAEGSSELDLWYCLRAAGILWYAIIMPSNESGPPEHPTAQLVFERMMRDEVAPALRELGFKGTFRRFRYAIDDYICFLRLQKSRWSDKRHVDFTLHVSMPFMMDVELFVLMPSRELPPQPWWVVRAEEPTEPVAEAVITAVRRYALPAIRAGYDASREPDPAVGWSRTFPPAGDTSGDARDGGGAGPEEWFVQPRGTDADRPFADLTSDSARDRYLAAELVAERFMADPRALPALLDRLEHDPAPGMRKAVVAILIPAIDDPQVRSALRAAAAEDEDIEVRWAARFELSMSPGSSEPAWS